MTSLRSFPASCPGDLPLYISGVLRVGDPVLYFIYCLFCTKYDTFIRGPPNVWLVITGTGRWPPDVHHPVTYHYVLPRRVLSVTSLRSFPASRRPGDRPLYLSGILRGGDPVLYVIYCHFCTKYELISSINTFCTCIHPYYVQKTYKTTYEFHFQLGFSRRVRAVTSLRSSLAPRRPGDRSFYLSGVLRGGDPVLYVIYCLFRTEYELICSFNTFYTWAT